MNKPRSVRILKNKHYRHIYRLKSCCDLLKITCGMFGLSFSTAVGKVFARPLMLTLARFVRGEIIFAWMMIALGSHALGPLLGVVSDMCPLKLGRRRPMILLTALMVIIGLILIFHGENNKTLSYNYMINSTISKKNRFKALPWYLVCSITGSVLVDFNIFAFLGSSRAYLFDLTLEDDHLRGLVTSSILTSLGSSVGYFYASSDWMKNRMDENNLLVKLPLNYSTQIITILVFVISVVITIFSFKEMPLRELQLKLKNEENEDFVDKKVNFLCTKLMTNETQFVEKHIYYKQIIKEASMVAHVDAPFKKYLRSTLYMPLSMWILRFTTIISWIAFFLYWHDYKAVFFDGSCNTTSTNESLSDYAEGFEGAIYTSLTSAIYSLLIGFLITIFGMKIVYISGMVVYFIGIWLKTMLKLQIIFDIASGILLSTLLVIPYLIVAQYHSRGTFELNRKGEGILRKHARGVGTDMALIESTIFFAQFLLFRTAEGIACFSKPILASGLTIFAGAVATQITYLDR